MCMFHVRQSSPSVVTIAFVFLSSFQTICHVRLAAPEVGGGEGGGGEGRLQGTPFSLEF